MTILPGKQAFAGGLTAGGHVFVYPRHVVAGIVARSSMYHNRVGTTNDKPFKRV